MTKPAKRTQRDKIAIYLKRQAWILFILIVLGWIVDVTWLGNNGNTLVIAKSNAIGALLSFATQPLSAPALFIGFMVMQISYSWMLWQIR